MKNLEFSRTKDGKSDVLRLSIDEYNGVDYVSARIWFRGRDGELLPTQKGVTFRARELDEVARWFADAATEIGIAPPEPKRPRLPQSLGGGPVLSPEEEAELF